jgi:hypothetical protein
MIMMAVFLKEADMRFAVEKATDGHKITSENCGAGTRPDLEENPRLWRGRVYLALRRHSV